MADPAAVPLPVEPQSTRVRVAALAIEVRGLVKRYPRTQVNAVDGVSFDVLEGQLFCLLGPNGAGKTTMSSILATTLAPTSGSVRIAGFDVAREQPDVRRQLGAVFQQPSLDLNLTVEENIRVHAILYGVYPWRPGYRSMPAAYRDHVRELAAVLGLADQLGRPVRTLSGGMRRRLEIVRALVHRPRVLVLDEPTAGLDPESRRDLWDHLREVRDRHAITIVLTTHYLEEAEEADSLCVLWQGRILERGTPAAIRARHARSEIVLDAADHEGLRRELAAMGIGAEPGRPVRVSLDGRSAQDVIRGLGTRLTVLRVAEPTLEAAYLALLERARS